MAETRPHTLDDFARIGGVGAAKLERYGAAFLAVISGEAAAPAHPARRKLAGRRGRSTTAFSPRRPVWPGGATGPESR
jgi:ATP-dependent DNA helicase RecQ